MGPPGLAMKRRHAQTGQKLSTLSDWRSVRAATRSVPQKRNGREEGGPYASVVHLGVVERS